MVGRRRPLGSSGGGNLKICREIFMELSEVDKAVVSAIVADLDSDPALVAQIKAFAQMQSNPYDFGQAVMRAMGVDGLKAFPRFQEIVNRYFPHSGLGIDIDWGDIIGAGITAAAGYFIADMTIDHQKDMAEMKIGFDERMFNRTMDEKEKTRLANEALTKAIQEANNSTKKRTGYTGSGNGNGNGDNDSMPDWVVPAAIGAGALVVGFVALK